MRGASLDGSRQETKNMNTKLSNYSIIYAIRNFYGLFGIPECFIISGYAI